VVVYIHNPRYVEGRGRKITSSRPVKAKLASPYLKNKIQTKKAEVMVQVAERLPSMCQAQDSIPSTLTPPSKNNSLHIKDSINTFE
jgi:hypothetical protein